jgi:hypothetical protein
LFELLPTSISEHHGSTHVGATTDPINASSTPGHRADLPVLATRAGRKPCAEQTAAVRKHFTIRYRKLSFKTGPRSVLAIFSISINSTHGSRARLGRPNNDLDQELAGGDRAKNRLKAPGPRFDDGRQLLQRLPAQYPGSYSDGQLRTLQRRLKTWRGEMARNLVLSSLSEHSSLEPCAAPGSDPRAPMRSDTGQAAIVLAVVKDKPFGWLPVWKLQARA